MLKTIFQTIHYVKSGAHNRDEFYTCTPNTREIVDAILSPLGKELMLVGELPLGLAVYTVEKKKGGRN